MNKVKLIYINWVKTIIIDEDDFNALPFHLKEISRNRELTDSELIEKFNGIRLKSVE